MRNATQSEESVHENRLAIQQKLQRLLAKQVSADDLVGKITRFLKSLGKKPGSAEFVAQHLANELAPRFTEKSKRLQRLIKYRPEQLLDLVDLALLDEVLREVIPALKTQKKSRAKIDTEEERTRRTKISKNRYEHNRRARATTPGFIEEDFADRSGLFLLTPHHSQVPTGPCLDKIFQGGTIKMCGGLYSLQSLFGLRRKRLSAAGSAIRRGRETRYNYRAVLRCMVALLKQTGPTARWLPDATRRRTVLTGVLFRAREKAKPEICEAFAKALLPYLN